MYFEFEDNQPDITHLPRVMPWERAGFVAVILHLLAVIAILLVPPPSTTEVEAKLAEQRALQQQRERESTRFVFVQPRLDMPATRALSPRAEASDKDRNAQTRFRAENPTNQMPFSRGNTVDRVEAAQARARAQETQRQAAPQPSTGQSSNPPGAPPPPTVNSLIQGSRASANGRVPNAPGTAGTGAGAGLLGSAERDAARFAQRDGFENPGGGAGVFGPSIQFDTKGVEFGPWLRRFIAQIKRNWFIPYAAMAMKGHVAITFVIAKDGTISSVAVPGPCNVDAFNRAAYNAIVGSNPTYPLPPEYPSERMPITVVFYYNETPPGGGYQ